MKIKNIKIANYRNLNGLEVHFHDSINFIVGENNLGKSNFLHLLNVLFNGWKFNDDDFLDKGSAIEIIFTLKLDDAELGNFDEYIDPLNGKEITIKATQKCDDSLGFYHEATDASIHPRLVRNINFVYYDSLRNPITDISFEKIRGASSFLNYMIKTKLTEKSLEEKDLINYNNQDFKDLLNEVNTTLNKIKSFKENLVSAKLETEIQNLLTKLVLLKDNNGGGLAKMGYGVQFSMLISLSILEKLVTIYEKKADKNICDYQEDGTNKKAISLILGLDEPEIHLHPYMQRALVKYLSSIIENTDREFSEIVKEVFEIDKLNGQIMIVTHSPNILFTDYKQIIRFYNVNNQLNIKSGIQINMPENEKHFLKLFSKIKEAFFSRCVIVAEGDSEPACLSLFVKTMNIDFDELGITVMDVGGKQSINPVMSVLDSFGILNVGLRDLDNEVKKERENLYFTDKRDFEEEIISILYLPDWKDLLLDILRQHFVNEDVPIQYRTPDDFKRKVRLQKKNFNEANSKYKHQHRNTDDIQGDISMCDFDSFDDEKKEYSY